MKIQTRLTLFFAVLTSTVLVIFTGVIYYSAEKNREKEFYTLLIKEAVTKANLIFEARVNPEILQDIYRNNRKILDEVEVAVYDDNFDLLYHDAVEIDFVQETDAMLTEILEKGQIQFYQKDWQVVGITQTFRDKTYIITAAARDGYGYNKINNLFKTAGITLLLSLLFVYPVSAFLAKKALIPVQKMNKKINAITASNIDSRLQINQNTRDELTILAENFNQMLNRLEKAFNSQKNFIQNISHELRTPLSSLISELELASSNNKNPDHNASRLNSALEDAKRIEKLTTSLLNLAKAEYDPSNISFKPLRPDETVLEGAILVKKNQPEYTFELNFQSNQDADDLPEITGNEYLLKIAFINLIENACKFSKDSKCAISISYSPQSVDLTFTDNGEGIPEDEIEHIFQSFYRGKHQKNTEGHGIGLSLVQKIIALHKGEIKVIESRPGKTTFQISLPRF